MTETYETYELPDDPGVTDVAPTSVTCATCGVRIEALNETLARFYLDRHVERDHATPPGPRGDVTTPAGRDAAGLPDLAPPLVRSTNGRTIHRETCRRPGARTPWIWAAGRTRDEIRVTASYLGVRACAFCRPLADADDDETRDEETR